MTRRRASRSLVVAALAGCAPARPAARVLRVGSSGDYAPFSVHDEAGWIGFDVEVARRFAQDTGRKLELVEFRWPALELDLAANRFDVAMSGVTMRPWRARVGTFTRPIARVGAVVARRAPASRRRSRSSTRVERRIGVNAGGYLERVARRLFRARRRSCPSATTASSRELLRRGTVDALVSDELEAPIFQRLCPDAVVLGPLTNDRKAYLARDPALAEELDAWLRAREVDGSLADLPRSRCSGRSGARRTRAARLGPGRAPRADRAPAGVHAGASPLAKEQRGLPTDGPRAGGAGAWRGHASARPSWPAPTRTASPPSSTR